MVNRGRLQDWLAFDMLVRGLNGWPWVCLAQTTTTDTQDDEICVEVLGLSEMELVPDWANTKVITTTGRS